MSHKQTKWEHLLELLYQRYRLERGHEHPRYHHQARARRAKQLANQCTRLTLYVALNRLWDEEERGAIY